MLRNGRLELATSLCQECLELLHVDRLTSLIYNGTLIGALLLCYWFMKNVTIPDNSFNDLKFRILLQMAKIEQTFSHNSKTMPLLISNMKHDCSLSKEALPVQRATKK